MSPSFLETSVLNQRRPIAREVVRVIGEKGACGPAGHVKNEFLAEFDEAAFGINFQLFKVPILGKLTYDSYELGSS